MARRNTERELTDFLNRHGYHHSGRKIHQEPTGRPVFAVHERDHHITTSGRRALTRDQFALPPGPDEKRRGIAGRLPIDTLKRARNALTRASQMKHRQHISAGQLAEVRRAVHRAWPSIESHATRSHSTIPKGKYTKEQILAMCKAPWQWEEQLRQEAKRRKLNVTSVTPLTTVVAALCEESSTRSHSTIRKEMPMKERLFIGSFPTGISYADRSREEHGDYMRLAFLPFGSLKLEWHKKQIPAELRQEIERHAARIQKRRGELYQVSTSGQTVLLGAK